MGVFGVVVMVVVMIVVMVVIMVMMVVVVVILHFEAAQAGAERVTKRAIGHV